METTNPETGVGMLSLSQAAEIAAGLPVDDDETSATNAQPEGDEPAGDESAEQEESAGQQQASDDTEEVEWDGSKYRIPKAVKPGLMFQADYTKKTQEVAERRRAVESAEAEIAKERGLYANQLASLVQQLSAAVQTVPSEEQLAEIAARDPVEYIRQKAERDKVLVRMQQAQSAQAELNRVQQAAQARQFQTALAEQRELLMTKIPEWRDAKVQQAEYPKVLQFMQEHVGLSPAEINQTYDHRLYVAARELMNARTELARLKATQANPKSVRPSLKPGAQNPAARSVPQNLTRRFGQTRSLEDAAAILNAIDGD